MPKFLTQFANWLELYRYKQEQNLKITLVDNGTWTNETRLGPIGDLILVVEQFSIQDNILVLAGDNLFEANIPSMIEISRTHEATVFASYRFPNRSALKNRFGVVVVDNNGRVLGFEEKPDEPQSNLAATALYVIPHNVLSLFINRPWSSFWPRRRIPG